MANTKIHEISGITIDDSELKITIDHENYSFKIKSISKVLAQATISQLQNYEISPSGYGIHWPELDEDLSIDGLIGKKNSVENRPSHGHLAV